MTQETLNRIRWVEAHVDSAGLVLLPLVVGVAFFQAGRVGAGMVSAFIALVMLADAVLGGER